MEYSGIIYIICIDRVSTHNNIILYSIREQLSFNTQVQYTFWSYNRTHIHEISKWDRKRESEENHLWYDFVYKMHKHILIRLYRYIGTHNRHGSNIWWDANTAYRIIRRKKANNFQHSPVVRRHSHLCCHICEVSVDIWNISNSSDCCSQQFARTGGTS